MSPELDSLLVWFLSFARDGIFIYGILGTAFLVWMFWERAPSAFKQFVTMTFPMILIVKIQPYMLSQFTNTDEITWLTNTWLTNIFLTHGTTIILLHTTLCFILLVIVPTLNRKVEP